MRKKIFGCISVCIVILLIIPHTTAITLINQNKIEKITFNKYSEAIENNYVDPNIYLTKSMLPFLEKALEQIDDSEHKSIIKSIIVIIREKEFANSKDIKNILMNLGIQNKKVESGYFKGYAQVGSKGYTVSCRPTLWRLNGEYWIGPGFYVEWFIKLTGSSKLEFINFDILGTHVTKDNEGFILYFIGLWGKHYGYGDSENAINSFRVLLWSPCIVWNYL